MIIVIIAGGSGTRLWPLSTPSFPKHLLSLTGERSMLQTTYDRAAKVADSVYIVTESGHADELRAQLPELAPEAFIVEPGRRGTASCIVAALDCLARRHDAEEPIAFIHADHHVRDAEGFARSFIIAAAAAKEKRSIALVGVEPTNPATGFGYIEKGEPIRLDSIVHYVCDFKEKPDFDTARNYVESGRYLWNCGYFVGTLTIFLGAMQKHAPVLYENFQKLQDINEDAKRYNDTYLSFENETIDIALIEKVDNLLAVPATFDWMDVGSFKDLHDANPSDEAGNFCKGKDIYPLEVENAFIRNEEDKPVAVIGLDNIVVVNTKHGILVARKDMSQRVGDIAKAIQKAKAT
ncbi:mannose-1-phosphate guanylyltransferase [Candidatus Saccharibacteria bacterium]|nr:mannose-1-phosphate guanylyltransferase [Candidatus Saccharibacteria bacterium]